MPIRQNRINVSSGVIEMSFPMPMTVDDVQDFKDAMAVTFRVLERTATNGQPASQEATSAPNIVDWAAQSKRTPGA